MKERNSFYRVLIMLIIAAICIIVPVKIKHNIVKPPPIVVNNKPLFFSKDAKEGLREALLYYNIEYPDIVYAQAVLETGNFNSTLCTVGNNLFGLYDSKRGKYYKFNHWTESVVKYKEWIQRRYKPPQDYYTFLKRIGYAEDSQYINKLRRIVNNESESSKGVSITRNS